MSSDDSTNDSGLPPGFDAAPARPQERGELLRAKIVGETARAPWKELQRFFAQGLVLQVNPGVDLIDVAIALAEDDRASFENFLNAGQAGAVTDDQALAWIDRDATLWTVVIRPWILVQDAEGAREHPPQTH